MKTFAVAHYCLFHNELTTELIEADSMMEAIKKHTKMESEDNQNWINDCPFASLDNIKQYFFDRDQMIDVIEVPSLNYEQLGVIELQPGVITHKDQIDYYVDSNGRRKRKDTTEYGVHLYNENHKG